MKEKHYKCHFCGKRFLHEKRFIAHNCTAMRRFEKLQTPLGQAAWQYYQDWMKLQRKRVPETKAFLKSRFYESFNRFSIHVKKLNLPNPHTFMRLMVDNGFDPTMWTTDPVYAIYMEHLDMVASPHEHAQITVDTILQVADALECDTGDIFAELTANEVIELIKERKMSPWVLLHSTKFMIFYQDVATPEQRILLEALVRYDYWVTQFAKKPKDVELMKDIVKEMNL